MAAPARWAAAATAGAAIAASAPRAGRHSHTATAQPRPRAPTPGPWRGPVGGGWRRVPGPKTLPCQGRPRRRPAVPAAGAPAPERGLRPGVLCPQAGGEPGAPAGWSKIGSRTCPASNARHFFSWAEALAPERWEPPPPQSLKGAGRGASPLEPSARTERRGVAAPEGSPPPPPPPPPPGGGAGGGWCRGSWAGCWGRCWAGRGR